MGEKSGLFRKGIRTLGTFIPPFYSTTSFLGLFPLKLGGGGEGGGDGDQKFDILFMTVAAGKVAQDIIYEGLLSIVLSLMMKK